MDSRLQLGDDSGSEPRYRATADAEHVGDDRLALALDQEPHQLPLARVELAEGLLDGAVRRLRFLRLRGRRLHDCPVCERRCRVPFNRGKGSHAAGIAAPAAGDVDRPVVGEPLQIGTAMIGSGPAHGIERRHRMLALCRSWQAAEVVEDQRDRVVERRRIANAPLPEDACDDEYRDRFRRMNQIFESGMAAG